MVTETTWNCLKNRYDSIIVGDRRPILTEQFKRQNAIYIQQIANNQEQISAIAKKKAQVEQTITPSTTTGATKIGSVDGTDLYAPPSGGGGGGSSEWGGPNDSKGTGTLYDDRTGTLLTDWVLNNTGFAIPEWSKQVCDSFGPQWDIHYNNHEVGIFDARAYKQSSGGSASDRGVHSKTRLGKGIVQVEQFKGTNDTTWKNKVSIGHSENRSDTQSDYGTAKSETHLYGNTVIHDVVTLTQHFKYGAQGVSGVRLDASNGTENLAPCIFYVPNTGPQCLMLGYADADGNIKPFVVGGTKFFRYMDFDQTLEVPWWPTE